MANRGSLDSVEFWVVVYDVDGCQYRFAVDIDTRVTLQSKYEQCEERGADETRDDRFVTFRDISGAIVQMPTRGYRASYQSTPASRERMTSINHAIKKAMRTITMFDPVDDD